MSEEHWKLEKDLCRCCLSEGSFKNLAEPCAVPGVGNIEYSEMLLESLDVNITPVAGSLCASTFTICDECILRLQDACIFKRQVLTSEKRFRDLYSRNVFESHSKELAVKKEALDSDNEDAVKMELEPDDDDFRLEYDDHDDNKSDIELDLQAVKKAKTKKPKGKEKPKPKKRAVRPRKPAEAEPGTEAEGEAEPKAKKGNPRVDEYVSVTDKDKKYTCKACEVSYKRISDLRYHVNRSHLKQKFIKCLHCPETFMYHSQRKQHIYKNHSKESPDKFTCDHCSRQFKRKNTLAEHMMDVHIEKECKQCDKCFVRKKYLFHLNEAHGFPMPTCGICGLRTLKQSSLVRHQRNVHLNEKNNKCSVCQKSFYTASHLQDHMITHEQKRVFACDACDKTFARKECWKSHRRIHAGERPFACKLCGVTFVQRASLRFHCKSRHPNT